MELGYGRALSTHRVGARQLTCHSADIGPRNASPASSGADACRGPFPHWATTNAPRINVARAELGWNATDVHAGADVVDAIALAIASSAASIVDDCEAGRAGRYAQTLDLLRAAADTTIFPCRERITASLGYDQLMGGGWQTSTSGLTERAGGLPPAARRLLVELEELVGDHVSWYGGQAPSTVGSSGRGLQFFRV